MFPSPASGRYAVFSPECPDEVLEVPESTGIGDLFYRGVGFPQHAFGIPQPNGVDGSLGAHVECFAEAAEEGGAVHGKLLGEFFHPDIAKSLAIDEVAGPFGQRIGGVC